MKIVSSLHTHVESLFDADIRPKRLLKRLKELGAESCAITDHGVLSAIEDYRRAFGETDIKFIPGCELYVNGGLLGRQHIILLAKDYDGYLAISKAVTVSNETLQSGFPVIPADRLLEILERSKGHVFCLSACLQGIVCSIYLSNETIKNKIEKTKANRDKYFAPNGPEITELKSRLDEANREYELGVTVRDATKADAEQKFGKREQALKKLLKKYGETSPEYLTEQAALADDKMRQENAVAALDEAKDRVKKLKSAISKIQSEYKDALESAEKWIAKQSEIKMLEDEIKSEEELDALASQTVLRYQEAVGKGNFYIELQNHDIPDEKACFTKALALAKRLDIPYVATNDVHILTNSDEDVLVRQTLKSLRFGDEFMPEEPADRELYLKSDEELKEALCHIIPEADADKAIANIKVISDACNVVWPEDPKHYPKFATSASNAYFDQELEKGVKERFPDGFPKGKEEEYQKRLDYEVSIIKQMGYVDYHLIVKDFLEYGRLLGYLSEDEIESAPLSIEELREYIHEKGYINAGMSIGNGRGSAAGSLACYCLGITSLDPIKHQLLFERFLNPERVSMPDIDSDISKTVREKVITYVKHKFGEKAVCSIMTKTFQAPKGAIAIAAKFWGLKNGKEYMSYRNTLSSCVPSAVGVSFGSLVDGKGQLCDAKDSGVRPLFDWLMDKYNADSDALEIIKWAKLLENAFTSYGAHAAGIVISDNNDVSDYLPLRYSATLPGLTTQCDMVQVEDNGLLKFDFLGLKTLDIITDCGKMIQKNHGIVIEPLKLNTEDPKVYKMLTSGKTKSVFQFESAGMTSMLKRFKPTCFEDLVILVSMFRPGPMQYIDGVIDVKSGVKEMTFLCPELKPILGKTYGAIVYQEQVMEIFQQLAGYSLGAADGVRRYMSKKKMDKLVHEKESFIHGDKARGIKGCVANGISESIAEQLFEQMTDFANYAFNKSHAACYALNAYITAWLKCYYPMEFITAALNWAEKPGEIAALMFEAKNLGVAVQAPNVNLSQAKFSCESGSILFGLSSIAGIKSFADKVIEERKNGKYTSLRDFYTRTSPASNMITSLIDSGACDDFYNNRAAMHRYIDDISDTFKEIKDKRDYIATATAVMPRIEECSTEDDVTALCKELGVRKLVKKPTTVEKLSASIEKSRAALASLSETLASVQYTAVKENPNKRMDEERDLLGVYVTAHPLDNFPDASQYNATEIAYIDETDERAYGVITFLRKKTTKKGDQMATFVLEDQSGTMECVVFPKAYRNIQHLLKNGNVLILDGETTVEVWEETETKKFTVDSAKAAEMKKKDVICFLSSFSALTAEKEQWLRANYGVEKGRTLVFYSKSEQRLKKADFCVKDEILSVQGFKEM